MPERRPLGLQLYSVRDLLAQDFTGTMRHIAEIGYTGVETAGFPDGVTSADAKQLFDDLGLTVIAAHSGLPIGDNKNAVLETMEALGCRYLVCAWLSPEDYFSSLAGVERACDLLNAANEAVQNAGLTLLYHNHWFEYQAVEGKLPYQIMLEKLDKTIGFEVDTYWVHTAKQDPVQVVQKLGKRAPLLHIKDGPAEMDKAMTAVGDGVLDFPPIIRESAAEWLIVELDRCDTDIMQAIAKSYQYLTTKELGHGRR